MEDRILLSPNHTQVSNQFLEEYMPQLSGSAVKIFLAICRKTIGWHKETDAISYTQIQKLTGIASPQTVKKAVDELVGRHLIGKDGGDGLTARYTLTYDTTTIFDGTTTISEVPTTTEIVVTKETSSKETIQNKRVAHEELGVPINRTRYDSLAGQYGKAAVDDAIQGRLDWEAANGKKPCKDYAAAAANWLKMSARMGKRGTADDLIDLARGM